MPLRLLEPSFEAPPVAPQDEVWVDEESIGRLCDLASAPQRGMTHPMTTPLPTSPRSRPRRPPGSRPCATASALPSKRSRRRRPARSPPRPAVPGASSARPGSARTIPVCLAAAAPWRCCAAGCSRNAASTSRRCMASSPPSSAARFRGGGGSALLRHRHLADRPSWNPHVPTVHMNTPLRGDDEDVVRRRGRPDPGPRPAPHAGRPGHGRLPRRLRGGLCPAPGR